jgi:hypothetical protein
MRALRDRLDQQQIVFSVETHENRGGPIPAPFPPEGFYSVAMLTSVPDSNST